MRDKFQVNIDIVRLYDEKNVQPEVTKVGIVPFIPAADPAAWKVMVMKPAAEAKHLGPPTFQLAKGTRHIHVSDSWCDMRDDDLRYADASFFEPIVRTALREGNEEIGLKPSNIKSLFDAGSFTFTSASKGKKRKLHMFAAEVHDPQDFAAYESSTAEVSWLTLAELEKLGRPDHVKMLEEILMLLQAKYPQGA